MTDYPWGTLLAVGHAMWRRSWVGLSLAIVVAGLVVTPWMVRNIGLTGSPVALAAQDLALRIDDPTADPEVWRTTLSPALPPVSLNKRGNKTLTTLQETLGHQLWSGGGLVLTAFFVTGWIYRFRKEGTNRLRTVFAIALAVMVLANGLMNSEEGERSPTVVVAH